MEFNMTDQQLEAYLASEKRILVSAAAGSGKTAVLVHRVGRLLLEGASLQRMLIITYTSAAAGELKDRIRAFLTNQYPAHPDKYGQALLDVESARISTIHSLGKDLILEHYEQLGISPEAREIRDEEKERLLEQAWHDSMNRLLEEAAPDFMALCDIFDNDKLQELCLQLYEFMMSLDDPIGWLERAAKETEVRPFANTVWFEPMAATVRLKVQVILEKARQLGRWAEDPDAIEKLRALPAQDMQSLEQVLQASEDGPEALLRACAEVSWARMPAVKASSLTTGEAIWKERYTRERNELKKQVSDLAQAFTPDQDTVGMELDNLGTQLRGLCLLMKRFCVRYRELKAENGLIDFHDMEQMAGEVLGMKGLQGVEGIRPVKDAEDIRSKVRKRFDHIFVDEFQDVSGIQYGLIKRLAGPDTCVFMVGDPKQSIYRFRNADPTIFMAMAERKTFGDGDEELPVRVIHLQQNFRSRAVILDCANDVFARAMRRSITELDYTEDERLIPGRKAEGRLPTELHIINVDECANSLIHEAAVVIRRIR